MSSRPMRRFPGTFELPARLDPAGRLGPTRGQAAGPGWRRVAHGWFVPAEVPAGRPAQRIAEAFPLLGEHGAVTGWAALHLWGAAYLDGYDDGAMLPVDLTLGPGQRRRSREGIHVLQEPIGQTVTWDGLRIHEAARALFDALRLADDLVDAVVTADMALAARVTTVPAVAALLARHTGWRGRPQALQALALSDAESDSPRETRLRMIWRAAGLPTPLVNPPVFSRATERHLGWPDLLDVAAGLAIEYDGEDHRSAARQAADHVRDELFADHGIRTVRVTKTAMNDETALVARLVERRARAPRLPEGARLWTLERPPGWHRRRPGR